MKYWKIANNLKFVFVNNSTWKLILLAHTNNQMRIANVTQKFNVCWLHIAKICGTSQCFLCHVSYMNLYDYQESIQVICDLVWLLGIIWPCITTKNFVWWAAPDEHLFIWVFFANFLRILYLIVSKFFFDLLYVLKQAEKRKENIRYHYLIFLLLY